MTAPLDVLRRAGEISALDEAMARSLSRLGGESRPEVLLATALVSRRVGQGDVCLDLPREVDAGAPAGAPEHAWPPLEAWLGALRDSPLVASARVGPATGPTGVSPLVLDERGRLYLRRCFEDERRVAERFLELARAPVAPFDPSQTAASLARLLPTTGDPGLETDWPRVAAAVALSRRLCVISGGPGTGKTTTAARLLGVLVEQARAAGEAVPRIVLAAPTGKAAARLSAAIAQTCDEIQCDDGVRDAIPREASTLHRLLGIGRERHGASALRLRVDVVLVDEASMIDLALMARLVSALSPQARLILLGDSDQLASVEAGSVFADLCGPERTPGYAEGTAQRLRELTQGPVPAHSPDFSSGSGSSNGSNFSDGSDLTAPVGDCVVVLRRSHRYREQSGIGALARAIRLGDPDAALSVLRDEAFPDVTRVEPTQERGLGPSLREQVLAGYGPCFGDEAPTDPVEQLRLLDRFRVLCAVREGPAGLRSMNPRIDAALVGKGLLTDPGRLLAVDGAQALAPSLSPAPGRPILVTRNAPHLGLFNGDVGLLDATGARACFDRGGEAVSFGIARLPSHELVFAMTVHKSQGSEFDEVALVLPPEPLPLVTRELVYTAVTRARTRVVVYASENVIEAGILARISRASGLRDALWPPGAGSGTVSVE